MAEPNPAAFRQLPVTLDPDQDGFDLLALLVQMPEGDPDRQRVRAFLVERHLPLVHHLAQRFRGRGEPYDDLVQVGTIGLINALDRFDPSRGSFTGYAVPTILGEIRRHFRDRGWILRVPRRLQESVRQIGEARTVLTQQLGRSPTVSELAKYLDIDPELVVEALDGASLYAAVPLPSGAADDEQFGALGAEDNALAAVEDRATLRPLLARLSRRERTVLALRFFSGLSQSQIAAQIGVSQMHVSRILASSLAKMREGLTEPG